MIFPSLTNLPFVQWIGFDGGKETIPLHGLMQKRTNKQQQQQQKTERKRKSLANYVQLPPTGTCY